MSCKYEVTVMLRPTKYVGEVESYEEAFTGEEGLRRLCFKGLKEHVCDGRL